jgi:15-cis-phytoene synthase
VAGFQTPAITPRAAADAARDICRHHARSFYFASHFLPQPKRARAYAVYAFCRLLDDAADESLSLAAVERFEQVLDDVYADRRLDVEQPALLAFADTVHACSIPKHLFRDLAEGCRMDFTITRYESWIDLERYCYHVAGVVGLIMCHVFGVNSESARDRAVRMGNAMQLTNILRDVREDFDQRGRIYLPRDEMARFGVDERALAGHDASPAFRDLIRLQVARARALYHDASRALPAIPDDGSRLTACVMATVYGGILRAIERLDYDVFAERARLSGRQKLARIPAALRLARLADGELPPTVF